MGNSRMEYDTTSIGEVFKPWLEHSTHQISAATADELFPLPYPERDLDQTSLRKLGLTIKKQAYIMEMEGAVSHLEEEEEEYSKLKEEKAYLMELENYVSNLEEENSKLKKEKEKQCTAAYASSKKETRRGMRKIGAQLYLEISSHILGRGSKMLQKNLTVCSNTSQRFVGLPFQEMQFFNWKGIRDAVGRSTIKRACRNYGIKRWPCNKKHKRNPSLFDTHPPNDSQQNMHPLTSSKLPLSDTFVHQNVPQTSTRYLTGQAEAKNVIIKVRFEDDTIKLELCPLSGMEKLLNEVAIRLSLKVGSFKLKYLDEDGDDILLACDADLQLYLRSLEKTCIKLFVHLIHK